jgi:hypothetical protein
MPIRWDGWDWVKLYILVSYRHRQAKKILPNVSGLVVLLHIIPSQHWCICWFGGICMVAKYLAAYFQLVVKLRKDRILLQYNL